MTEKPVLRDGNRSEKGICKGGLLSTLTDKILVSEIECVAAIGVTAEERKVKQRLSVDVEVSTDTRRAAQTDRLKDTIDYAQIVTLVVELAGSREFHLVETFAELIAGRVRADLGGGTIRVVVRKSPPDLSDQVRFVSVEIARTPEEAGS